MTVPISPPPVTESGTGDLPAYVSNGLIGLRVLDIPLFAGYSLVDGFAGEHPTARVLAAARTPYPLGGDLAIDDIWLRRAPHLASFVDQRYDFATGELWTRFRFSAHGVTAEAEVLTLCSRRRPTIALQELTVRVDAPCSLNLRAIVDIEGVPGRVAERRLDVTDDAMAVPTALSWASLGDRMECGIALGTEVASGGAAPRTTDWGAESGLAEEVAFQARPGRAYRFRQIVSLVAGVLHHDPEAQAMRLCAEATAAGFDALRAENREAWAELWRGRVLIDADDPQWQSLADAAFFYLNASTHPSAPASTSIFGLATWHDYHYYYGHVMWDIETFTVPPLLWSQPDAAYALLDFRSRTLAAAKSHARMGGHMGTQYPWESDPLHGEEVAPGIGHASWHEDHVTPDVALGFAAYAHATGNDQFARYELPPVLFGVAEWITSRVSRTPSGYSFKDTMGIAERKHPADDDAFTIMASRRVLAEAIACAERVGVTPPRTWREVERGLVLRPSAANGAIMSHDGYHPTEEKGATPGPLAGIFPAWYELDPAVEKATLDYYLRLAPQYVGSPMLSALYPTWACWAGDRRLAAQLLREGYAELVGGRFLQTFEQHPVKYPDKPRSGPFFANLGGFLMTLMYGLPAIRIGPEDPEAWPRRRVVLPAGWRSIEIERAWIRGREAHIEARHGAARAQVNVRQGRARRAA
jgi:protein-glucosylgalactosylhydroxylysine glucosidase